MRDGLDAALQSIVGAAGLASPDDTRYHHDATESQGLRGRPDAVALPSCTEEIRQVVEWCYSHDVPLVPRGGGSGFSGGCVPVERGVVVDLSRMSRVRAYDPLLWRMHVEAGLRTSEVRRLARESGLLFPPDPGAAEESQIGGNVATNAGGPHAFKYGVTGRWVTGIEAIVPPGEVVTVGGPIRKDVAGYDIGGLLIGSEGTLGILSAVWLRLVPAPEAVRPVVAVYANARNGCEAIEAVLGSGIQASAIEFLDQGALDAARSAYPLGLPAEAGFMVLTEADGSEAETAAVAADLEEALAEGALAVQAPSTKAEIADLWRWRDGVSIAVEAIAGGKVSEDVVVPLDRLADAIEATVEIGARHRLAACGWGHAGDGNLHSTFLVDPKDPEEIARAHDAAGRLYEAAAAMDGSISGEHGLGWVKRGHLGSQWNAATLDLHRALKRAIDPKNLMNPGKKV